MSERRIVMLDVDELTEIVRGAVVEATSTLARSAEAAPKLLDRKSLAAALDISLAALDRLRSEPSFPELKIGDAPRFEIDRVLEWLRSRSQAPGLRLVGTR